MSRLAPGQHRPVLVAMCRLRDGRNPRSIPGGAPTMMATLAERRGRGRTPRVQRVPMLSTAGWVVVMRWGCPRSGWRSRHGGGRVLTGAGRCAARRGPGHLPQRMRGRWRRSPRRCRTARRTPRSRVPVQRRRTRPASRRRERRATRCRGGRSGPGPRRRRGTGSGLPRCGRSPGCWRCGCGRVRRWRTRPGRRPSQPVRPDAGLVGGIRAGSVRCSERGRGRTPGCRS